jgi:hypothetical protein
MHGDHLTYQGREFRRGGDKWPSSMSASRVSPDGNTLAVNGWEGEAVAWGDLNEFGGSRIDGNYYVNVYDTRREVLLFSLSGRFHKIFPGQLFGGSAWISDRYYVFPLNDSHNHFVLCETKRVSSGR